MREHLRRILMAVYSVGYCTRDMMRDYGYGSWRTYLKILKWMGCIEIEGGVAKPGKDFYKCLDLMGIVGMDRQVGGVVYALLGDMHIGRKTETFNYNILKARMDRYVDRLRILRETGYKVIMLGLGDYVDGAGIYGRQAYEQEFNPNQQVAKFIELMTPVLNVVDEFYGIVGNHGRTNEDEHGNYDYLALESLRGIYGRRVNVSERYVDVFNINGERILLGHVKFRSYYGIPDYSIRRFVHAQALSRRVNAIFLGHYHAVKAWFEGDILVVLNGTFLSDDELSYQYGLKPGIGQVIVIRDGARSNIEVVGLE